MGLFGPPNVEKLKAKRDVKDLIKALGYQKDASVRRAAADALGELGDARAVEPLIAALKDKDSDACWKAAEALGELKDARAVEPLIAALNDRHGTVRQAAAKALDKIGWQPGKDEAGAAYWIGKQNWEECVRIGAPAVEPLIAALKDGGWYVRGDAARALGELKDARAVEPLVAALKDRDVCMVAAEALGKIDDARVVVSLIAALKDGDFLVREAAAGALDKIGWQPGKDEAGAAYWIAKRNWEECVRIGAPAVEPLIAALKNQNPVARTDDAAKALVSLYRAGQLDETDKKAILAHRQEITIPHHDNWSDCTGHSNHTDYGGIEFPL